MSILEMLECPVCLEYMIEEIHLCDSGHSVCQKCKNQLTPPVCPLCQKGFSDARNYALERIAGITIFTCKYQGCGVKLEGTAMKNHELSCEYQTCVLSFDECNWKGSREEISKHIHDVHSDCIKNYHKCVKEDLDVYLIFEFEQLFVIFRKTDLNNNCTNYAAMLISLKREEVASVEEFRITLSENNDLQKVYQLVVSAPCINRCPISEVFNTHKIVIHSAMMNQLGLEKCFLKINSPHKVPVCSIDKPEPCVLDFNGCTWSGTRKEIYEHVKCRHFWHFKNFNTCDIPNLYVYLIHDYGALFVVFRITDSNLNFNYVGMYVPLEEDEKSLPAEAYKLVIRREDTSTRTSMSVIERCCIGAIFKMDKIIVPRNLTEKVLIFRN